jgi:hypothetical protein
MGFFMRIHRSALYVLILPSTLPIQSSDWLSEELKSAACLSFGGIGATYMWHQRNIAPTMALYQTANRLLEDRFALNRSESDWNLAGSLVYDLSTEEYNTFLKEDNLNPERLESYESKRINMSLDENLKPDRLRELKDKIIITCTFEKIDHKKLSQYNDELQSTIDQFQPQNKWQQLTQRRADQELLQKLIYKREQMSAFQEIIEARKIAIHKQKLQAMLGIN